MTIIWHFKLYPSLAFLYILNHMKVEAFSNMSIYFGSIIFISHCCLYHAHVTAYDKPALFVHCCVVSVCILDVSMAFPVVNIWQK